MAALLRCGWESRAVILEVTTTGEIKGAPTIDTTNQRKVTVGTEKGGLACIKFSPNAAEQSLHAATAFTGAKERWTYYRVCLRKKGTTGGARTIIRFWATEGELLSSVDVTAAHKLELKNGAGTVVGSVENGLNEAGMTNQGGYHVIEFAIWVHTSNKETCKARWWVDGVEIHKNETTYIVQKANPPSGIKVGWVTPETTAELFCDDLGVNDETGTKNNTNLGTGGIIGALVPTSEEARVGFKGGGGGEGELFKAVDAPPEGLVDASKTNTSQIYDSTSSTTDFYEGKTATYTALGVGASDLINLIFGYCYASRTTTNCTAGIAAISNPAITEATASITVTAGTFPSGWVPLKTLVTDEPSPTLGTAVVLKYRKGTATATPLHCCYMALMVEWTPKEAAGGVTQNVRQIT